MKRFSQQFNTAAKRVTMTKAESRDLRERLVSYMEYHPLPEGQRAPATMAAESSFFIIHFNTARNRVFAGMSMLAALIIIPFAAERSVPGDVLYPIKVQFNEEIRSTLALTPYQKVEWETARVERRLAEARLLATEGKLTEAIEAAVAAAVKEHSEAAQASLAVLRETDRDEAAIAELSFASSLEVESEVLEQETARQAATGASTSAQLAAAVADVRARVATPETTEVSFDRLLARVEEETTHASELLYSLRNEVTTQEREDIDRRLADIGRKMELALSSRATSTPESVDTVADATTIATTSTSTLAATSTTTVSAPAPIDEPTAKQYLREALRDAQKLVRFMTDIDVKVNVSVDELVPVSLTDEERITRINQQLNTIAEQVETLEQRATANAKLDTALETVADLTAQANSAVAVANLTTAEAATAQALVILDDMLRATANDPVTETTLSTVSTSTITETGSTTTLDVSTESVVETAVELTQE
jgi:hypothetical protein